jgi:hypothetical protein
LLELYRQQFTVAAIGENLITLGITYDDPAIAYQLADATIRVYKAWKLNVDRQESTVAQAFFTDLITPLRKELDDARATLDGFLAENPDPVRGERPLAEQVQIQRYQDAIEAIEARLQDAISKEESARLAMSQAESDVDQTFLLIDAPRLPIEPEMSLRQMALIGAIFTAVGLILTAASIIGGVLIDRSLRLEIDVRHELQLPVLAQVADSTRLPKRKGKQRGKPTVKESSEQPIADLRLEDKPAQ